MVKIERPWGRMWVLVQTKWFWVKIIRVDPYECTSLQYHNRRSELHIAFKNEEHKPWVNFNLIRPKVVHRMYEGLYLELAWGRVAEEDIKRLEDKYDR